MLRRKKKDIQSNQLRVPENTVTGLFAWPLGAFKNIVKSFGASKKTVATVPSRKPDKHTERPAFPTRCIVFSDTDNDVNSVKNTLRFVGLINEKGDFTDTFKGITIFHTGDLLDKRNPDPSIVEYWQTLQQGALKKGCQVKLLVGNHEQEIWQKIQAGKDFGMESQQAHWLNDFVEKLDLFYVAGPVLFIHGYPTLEFLQTLQHFKEVTGKDLNCFNTDHYKKAFRSVNAMRQYAYARENRQANYLLYDVADASRYYKKQGRVVSAVLAKLKIEIIVHGHRPQRSGVQVDYEFSKWIPNIRMIGNDTMVRHKGIGATVMMTASSGVLDIVFINGKTKSNKLRRKVQEDLGSSFVSSRTTRVTHLETADIEPAAQG